MIGIDGSGRDGGGRIEDIPLTYSPSFHFFFLFLLPFSFFLFFTVFFQQIFFQRYLEE